MEHFTVILTFTAGLVFALILGYIAQRLRISPIVGYLLAGIVVEPFSPGFVADREMAKQLAEIGVILLLFGVGLRFHLREFLTVWRFAVPGALIQSTASTLMMAALLHYLLGWTWTSGIVLGMAISVASTVVMALVLDARHDLHAAIGYIAVGWTVVEDILTVVMLLVLPVIFGTGTAAAAGSFATTVTVLSWAFLKIIGFVVCIIVLGRFFIPWVLARIEATRSRELFTLSILALALGIAACAAMLFGVSMELGAFLAGLAVGRSDFASRAANDALPMKDAFAVLFFVSVGMLFDFNNLIANPLPVILVLFVVIIGKPAAAALTVRLLGKPWQIAVPVGAAFSQVGEFSFILGVMALELGVFDSTAWNAMIAASIISIALNPTVYGVLRRLSSPSPNIKPLPAAQPVVVDPHRCILVGYGPVGQIVHRLLADRGTDVTVVEFNFATVRHLKDAGVKALHGDVLQPGILEDAGIAAAGSLVISVDVADSAEIVRQVRMLNSNIRILVRCQHLRDAALLRKAGADVAAAGEAEVAVALAEAVTAEDEPDHASMILQRELVRRHMYDAPSGSV
jgi:CPA2 family monovalent cation:H+ antiporter-2